MIAAYHLCGKIAAWSVTQIGARLHHGDPGIVFGQSVACPLHNWCIDLATGAAAAPDEGRVRRFDVSVVDGLVELEAPL